MTSRMSLSEEQDTQKVERLVQGKRYDPPEPSCVSMKSDQSMDFPLHFREGNSSAELRPVQGKRHVPPEPSCVSMKSDQSMDFPLHFREGNSSAELRLVQGKRHDPPEPSCVSMKSDQSMDFPLHFREGNSSAELSVREKPNSPDPSHVSMKSDQSTDIPPILKEEGSFTELRAQKETSDTARRNLKLILQELEHKVLLVVKSNLKNFMKLLSADYPACSKREVEDKEDQSRVREAALEITLHVLRNMNQTDLANTLQNKLAPSCHQKLKLTLKEKSQRINEGISSPGTSTLLNEIFTELYITEGGSRKISNEHEVRQIEKTCRRPAALEIPIKCNDLFKNKSVRTVLTKGVAGIGKTVSVQKFILDWAEGKANQDVLHIFPLPFRELNLMKTKNLSLLALLHEFFRDTKELKPRDYDNYKVIFIFDGLDECRLPLDFQNNESLSDVTQPASVDVLLTNLIKGNLLPSALLWITSRPAAANQIPPGCVSQVTEVRGFSDSQKEEYFKKRICDQSLADKIISHMKSSRSLYIMCHIPVFCWISATVLGRLLGKAESGEIPKTLTQMFINFLVFQMKHGNQKYHGNDIDQKQTRKIILALGKLAFQQLEKGNLIFYEEDLIECGIDDREVSVYSGVCTQIFREEFGLHLGKVFSFVHLSIQEFMAALYAFLSFISKNRNVLLQPASRGFSFTKNLAKFLKSAVDKALESKNGHLDLFLRFLFGLSLESNQILLRGLLIQTGSAPYNKQKVVPYIKEKIRENPSPEKTINLFHCLNELNDHSLVQEVQTYLNRGSRGLGGVKLSPAQWSAVAFVLLNMEEELDEFDLRKYDPSEECFLRLLPVVKAYRKIVLPGCNLTAVSFEELASALQSPDSSLKELDLSNNELQYTGVKHLSFGLKSSHCKLEILRLSGCKVTDEECSFLASALKSNHSHLRELDLTYNHLGESGVKLLSDLLENPHCKLQKLQLSCCNLSAISCEKLESALQSPNSSLKELDLSNNDLQDSGVELLSAGLKSPHCKLEILRLSGCMVTDEGCSSLASALKSNPSHLKELDLTYNHPGESGVKLLSDLLEDPHCRLKKLQMEFAGKIRMKPGLKKYACNITLDPNTAHTSLFLSEENRKVECMRADLSYPDHPDRFDGYLQVLSVESLSERCYWETEWRGGGSVCVSYKGIRRTGDSEECVFGYNNQSWSLECARSRFSLRQNKMKTKISNSSFISRFHRVGVYLDWTAGTLSFYIISPNEHTPTHLHTVHTTFTEPLYAGFGVLSRSSIHVCVIE